jgi:UDP:flavonoid glycosyltransferase YjiC (YdhE family)
LPSAPPVPWRPPSARATSGSTPCPPPRFWGCPARSPGGSRGVPRRPASRSGYLKSLLEAELQAARDFKADRLFTDLDLGAFLLARIAGLPIAAAYQSLMVWGVPSLPWRLLNLAVGSVLRSNSLPGERVDALCYGPRVLKIIPSIPELEDTDPNRADVCYVGQLLEDIQKGLSFQPEPGRRYVFVYVGTASIPIRTLRSILPQVFTTQGKQICLVGAQSVQEVERIGAVEFRPYLPAGVLLPFCDWTLCHGGQNTIIQSLLHGVPLMVFPGPLFERRYNARKVQAAGAGQMGEIDDFNPAFLKATLSKQEEYAPIARALGDRIRSFGGAPAAVSAIEKWGWSI